MILAFAEDSTVRALDTIEQANVYCETIDVEEGVYTFLDERGFVLVPVITPPRRKRFLGTTMICGTGAFRLQRTSDRRDDIVRRFIAGEIAVEKGPTDMNSLVAIRRRCADLFVLSE